MFLENALYFADFIISATLLTYGIALISKKKADIKTFLGWLMCMLAVGIWIVTLLKQFYW